MTGTDSTDGDLLYEVRVGVGYATFNRPVARNALTFAMYDRLA
jgi:enoyl-CoA hydratase/carnithine racemase